MPNKDVDGKYLVYILNESDFIRKQWAKGLQGSAVLKHTIKQLRPIEKAKIMCARKLFNEISTDNVVYHDVDSYQSLLNIMNDPSLDKKVCE